MREMDLEPLEPRVMLSASAVASAGGPAPDLAAVMATAAVGQINGGGAHLTPTQPQLAYDPAASLDNIFAKTDGPPGRSPAAQGHETAAPSQTANSDAAGSDASAGTADGDALTERVSATSSAPKSPSVLRDGPLLPTRAVQDLNGKQAAQLTETLRSANGPPSANGNQISGTTTATQKTSASSSSAGVSAVAKTASANSGSAAAGSPPFQPFSLPQFETYMANIRSGGDAPFNLPEAGLDNGLFDVKGISGTKSGTNITFSAASVTLYSGRSFTASFAITNGTYNSTTSATIYRFDFIVSGLVLSVGEALNITAPSVRFQYTPAGDPSPGFAATAAGTVTAGSPPTVTGMPAVNVSGFQLKETGFSFNGFTLPGSGSASMTIGSPAVLSIGGASLTVAGGTSTTPFSVTYGTTSTVSGSITLALSTAKLFPTASFSQNLSSTNITAAYDLSTFDGTNPSAGLKLIIGGFKMDLGPLEVAANQVVLTPGQSTMATIASASLVFKQFSGLSPLVLSNFQLNQAGFSIGSLNATLLGPAGGVTAPGTTLGFDTIGVSLTTFGFSNSTASFTGIFGLTITNLKLFPGMQFLNAQVSSVQATYTPDAAAGLSLAISIPSIDLIFGGAVDVTANNVTLFPGRNTMATVNGATVKLFNQNLTGTIGTLQFLNTGQEGEALMDSRHADPVATILGPPLWV